MATNIRSERLAKYFDTCIHGKQDIHDLNSFKRLIEAILDQKDATVAVQRLVTSSHALSALRTGLRFNITPEFINAYTSRFILFLRKPEIKLLGSGFFFQQTLLTILDPPILWSACVDAFCTQKLDADAAEALCWLTTELLSLPSSSGVDITADAQAIVNDSLWIACPSVSLRNLCHKIRYLLTMKSSGPAIIASQDTYSPGGRHDNDFADFRRIAILPTADEIECTEKPFFREVEELEQLSGTERVAAHVDNQFRLLREDMLSVLRDDIQIASGTKKGRRSALRLGGLGLADISCLSENQKRQRPCTLGVFAKSGLNRLVDIRKESRKGFLKDNPQFVKHSALGCLIRNSEIVAFAKIDRNMECLTSDPPVVRLRVLGNEALRKSILFLKLYHDLEFLVVDTPTFAYEPILKCLQDKSEFPLTEELFLHKRGEPVGHSRLAPHRVIGDLKGAYRENVQHIFKTAQSIKLDPSQHESLLTGLTQRVSLIQGPPGTGKSFIGALLAKALHDNTNDNILVMCYTNHALDQFLEDLIDIGIENSSIVRLGSKSTPRTQSLGVREQYTKRSRSQLTWTTINQLEMGGRDQMDSLYDAFDEYRGLTTDLNSIMEYLEFEDPEFFEAFTIPANVNGLTMVGKNGTVLKPDYLFRRWIEGKSPKPFTDLLPAQCRSIWDLNQKSRSEKLESWKRAVLDERAASLALKIKMFDKNQRLLETAWGETTRELLRRKRIIGCTTTAAAMYAEDLRDVAPKIVLLEEAGEILESHVLTALSPETEHLIMIGDHRQLRPKINSYSLSAEKGDGYDLNVSLFERLAQSGYPHTTLLKQHRMCPEISSLVRLLTYPELEDADKTKGRPEPRGLCDRVIFFNHSHSETSFSAISEKREGGASQSKQNPFEADIVLKIVKYLGQQGYGTEKLVVLTPYLGQLSFLRQTLSKQNDPVLNDLDSHDLVKAGLLSNASANHSKRPIKLSTIDNYQGEESEIVIASLTRSNQNGDIGFMAAPERLNVLLSRARNVLIVVGNSETFVSSKKGQKVWGPLINNLKANGHLYDGLPVKCEQHPQKTGILRTAEDFERESPDGGCTESCGVKLSCGIHECPSKCHQLVDHSKMRCTKIVKWDCSRSHTLSSACSAVKGACRFCIQEDKIKEQKRERDEKLEAERQRNQAAYAKELAELESEVSYLRRIKSDGFTSAERARVLSQYQQEINDLKNPKGPPGIVTSNPILLPQTPSTPEINVIEQGHNPPVPDDITTSENTLIKTPQQTPKTGQGILTVGPSKAKTDWEYQKTFHNAQSREIDSLMGMIGLESVKEKFLVIKSKVDLFIRQNADLSRERFGTVLLGNPGTGKTTVARLYAKFLSSVGIIPGHKFIETTGSRLANDGVSKCQNMIDDILKEGGGVVFIDEAYQLAQGSNFACSQVLDFLLAEIENLTGKIVFILAGYQRPMEKFFAHNPGLPSRFPHELKFADFEDAELMLILEHHIEKKYKKQMKIEDGPGGLYCRIVARRIGRGRGSEGFANARAVENILTKISERQSERLKKHRKGSLVPADDFFLTGQDMIGPDPSQSLKCSTAWEKLQRMIGLTEVKIAVKALTDTIKYNYSRELSEQPLVEFSLNRVFLGNPGTGKTSVAKIYGQILVDMGLLSNGEVVVKDPSDFVGSVIGESEKNTKGILAATVGKVLVIDEAYGLCGGGPSDGTGARTDIYRSAVIDTIVAEVQSTPGDDRCVLLLGYKDQMEQMFQNVNPGLSRRFPVDQGFVFEDFNKQELNLILDLKLNEQGYGITDRGRRVVLEILERARNRANFGNAGEIDNLLNAAKMNHQSRLSSSILNGSFDAVLDAVDFDKDFDRAEKSAGSVKAIFKDDVGCEAIISKLEGYQQMARNLSQLNMDPKDQIPFNFIFRGPPGTGKTTTARRMGKVYYDMGLLSSNEVVETSATDLVGQYVGQTGPKTQKTLERALGKILFIDEAYRLADGQFAKEAMDELVDCITKPKFFKKMIIILAGYDVDINQLLSINPGLTSRFPESLQFEPLSPGHSISLFVKLLSKEKEAMLSNSATDFDITCLLSPDIDMNKRLAKGFETLSTTRGWANARDVTTLAKTVFGNTLKTMQVSGFAKLVLKKETVIDELENMITERSNRVNHNTRHAEFGYSNVQKMLPLHTQSLKTSMRSSSSGQKSNANSSNDSQADEIQQINKHQGNLVPQRDTNVPDGVWNQLEIDKGKAEAVEKEFERSIFEEKEHQTDLQALEEEHDRIALQADEAKLQANEELKRQLEQKRLQLEIERQKQESIARDIENRRRAREEAHRKEQANQEKLRAMGRCIQGYRWIKQTGGYRCAGGYHWVPDAELDLV